MVYIAEIGFVKSRFMAERITILTLEDRERWEAEHRQGGLPSHSWLYAWGLTASGFYPKLAVVENGGARMLYRSLNDPD
jgi:hypothetical protein